MIDFTLDGRLEEIRRRTREFVEDQVLPVEADRGNWDAHDNIADGPLQALRAKARAAGLWCPQVPEALGGMGLPVIGRAVMYEEANRSIFGPVVFNCAAPDDGNMDVLATRRHAGTEGALAGSRSWTGDVRSSFAMTEPAPGGGSDPA